MAIKACGWVDGIEEIGGELVISVTVTNLAGETHRGVRAGSFGPETPRADVTVALIKFLREHAELTMGATFDEGDEARLWTTTGVA